MCVQDLPLADDGGPTTWDLRHLILEGDSEPVPSSVVKLWLDMLYSHVDTARQLRPFRTLQEAKPLLLFADAAGTCDAALRELFNLLTSGGAGGALRLQVPLGGAVPHVEVLLQGRLYRSAPSEGLVYVDICGSGGAAAAAVTDSAKTLAVARNAFMPHRSAFIARLVGQLESWLYLAGRLAAVPLVRLLLGFVRTQLLCGTDSILGIDAAEVFSRRVLEVMPREVLLEGFLHHALLYRPNDMQLALTGGELRAKVVRDEAAAVVRLEAGLSGLTAGATASASVLRPSVNRSQMVMGRGGGGRAVPVNVCVGGYSAARCGRAVSAAVQRAADREEA